MRGDLPIVFVVAAAGGGVVEDAGGAGGHAADLIRTLAHAAGVAAHGHQAHRRLSCVGRLNVQ